MVDAEELQPPLPVAAPDPEARKHGRNDDGRYYIASCCLPPEVFTTSQLWRCILGSVSFPFYLRYAWHPNWVSFGGGVGMERGSSLNYPSYSGNNSILLLRLVSLFSWLCLTHKKIRLIFFYRNVGRDMSCSNGALLPVNIVGRHIFKKWWRILHFNFPKIMKWL